MSGCSVSAGDQTSHPGAVHQDHHHVALRLHRRLLRDAQPALRRLRGRLPVPDPRQRLRLQLHHVRAENGHKIRRKLRQQFRKVWNSLDWQGGDVIPDERWIESRWKSKRHNYAKS